MIISHLLQKTLKIEKLPKTLRNRKLIPALIYSSSRLWYKWKQRQVWNLNLLSNIRVLQFLKKFWKFARTIMLFNTFQDPANLWNLVSPLILLSGMRLHSFSECAFRIHDMLISLYGKHGTIYIPRDMNLSESVAAAKFRRFRIANIASLSLNWEKRLRNKVASHTTSKQRDHGRISTFLLIRRGRERERELDTERWLPRRVWNLSKFTFIVSGDRESSPWLGDDSGSYFGWDFNC